MAEETSTPAEQPVKRRPGRPRKNPVAAPETPATPDTVAAEVAPAKDEKPAPTDKWIGHEVHPLATSFGADGHTYRCAGGKIVERVA
jgi:hypothetical protein